MNHLAASGAPLLTCHPVANVFPMLQGSELDALIDDIRLNGLYEAITTYQGQILDGRNRYLACQAIGIEPPTVTYDGDDPVSFVLSVNLHRRHLNDTQRAMVATTLATLQRGRPGDNGATAPITQEQAGALLHVSRDSVKRARAVRDTGIPELIELAEQGQVAVAVAAEVARQSTENQRRLIAMPPAQLLAAVRAVSKREKREHRIEELAQATVEASQALGGAKRYAVIYADPPWRFEPYSRESGLDRAADNHYATMAVADICAMEVPAANDCVLFLWATAPMLLEALEVMRSWGFQYRSHLAWVKDRIGTGYWARSRHELLLIGVKGDVPAPVPGQQPDSVIEARVGEHSEKPVAFAELIEELFPGVPALEMFARGPRLGWDVWGNQAVGA